MKECWVYACQLPELERQKETRSILQSMNPALSAGKFTELSEQKRQMHRLQIQNKNNKTRKIKISFDLATTLYQTKLETGPPETNVNLPTKKELEKYLLPSFSLDYNEATVQSFLDKNSFRRKSAESDICFAWRVFCRLRRMYLYRWHPNLDRQVSKTCQSNATDCGGLSYLYCAILRANKIPARPLIGRWANSSPRAEDSLGYYNCHVKSEFFDSKIGWVPVDLSEAITNRKKKALEYFGKDPGDFVVIHENPDLVLKAPDKSLKKVRSIPDFRIWIKNASGLTIPPRNIEWTVSKEKL